MSWMLLNLGPQHPSTHRVLRLVLRLEGETVVDCTPVIGYLHCGIEKILENRPIMGGIRYMDNADYLSDSSDYPWRVKLRGPSLVNLQILPEVVRGYRMSDVIAILGSLDLILGEVDRKRKGHTGLQSNWCVRCVEVHWRLVTLGGRLVT